MIIGWRFPGNWLTPILSHKWKQLGNKLTLFTEITGSSPGSWPPPSKAVSIELDQHIVRYIQVKGSPDAVREYPRVLPTSRLPFTTWSDTGGVLWWRLSQWWFRSPNRSHLVHSRLLLPMMVKDCHFTLTLAVITAGSPERHIP